MNDRAGIVGGLVDTDPTLAGIEITAEQRRRFDTDGYFVVEGALSPGEVAELVEVVDFFDAAVRRDHGLPADAPVSVRNIVCRHEAFQRLLDRPRILGLIVDVLGPWIHLRASNVDVRPPRQEREERDEPADAHAHDRFSQWHRDEPADGWPTVGGVVPFLELKVGYYLTDLTAPLSGALRLLPGSHRWPEGRTLDAAPQSEPGADQIAEISVPAGTALVWRTSLLHRVAPNRSGRTRKCIYLAYQHRWLRPSDYVTAPPDVLARCNPIQRQLLGALGEGLCELRDPEVEPCSPYWTPRPEDVPLEAWARGRGWDGARSRDVPPA
jgi:ectoine hydroxylase-related dioxygenase (phytanoyl-CoA dioxygenase family)